MALDLSWAVNAKRAVAVNVFLASTCTITRTTETTDAGGSTEVRTTLATGVPCFYTEDLTAQEIARAEQLSIAVSGRLFLPGDQDVTVADEITDLTLPNGDVIGSYEVVSAPRATYEVTRIVLVAGPI